MNPTGWIWLALAIVSPACGSAPPAPEAPDDQASLEAPTGEGHEGTADEIDAPCETPDDCNNQGAMALLAGRFDEALPLLTKGCRLDSGSACSNLGGAYLRGDFGQPDRVRALGYLERACDLDADSACTDAGVIVHRGEGVARDGGRALELFDRGCAGGDEQGCFNGGLLLASGGEVPTDGARALELFELACHRGHPTACSNVGILLYQGRLVPQDYDRAASFFERACDRDVTDGCFNLGVSHLKGHGVPVDRDRAGELFRKACDGGDRDACDISAELEQGQATPGGAESTSVGASSMTVNGLTVTDMSCRLSGGGLMGTLTIIAGLAERKSALDKCAPKGDRPSVSWTMSKGKTTEVEVTGAASKKIARCVERALKKMRSSIDGRCSGIIHLGR